MFMIIRLVGKTFPCTGEAKGGLDQVDDPFGVSPVNNGKTGAESEMMAVAPEQHVRGRMKCTSKDFVAGLVDKSGGPQEHFLGSPAGKGQEKY